MSGRMLCLIGLLVVVVIAYALFAGQMIVDPLRLADGDARTTSFLLELRLPRLLTAALVGAGLATAGAMLQGILRNDLVEPGILGVNAGAELGVLLALVFYSGPGWGSLLLLPFAAWTGALLAIAIVGLLSLRRGGAPPLQVLLTGLAVTMLLGTINTVLGLTLRPTTLAVAVSWQSGSLGGASWEQLKLLTPVLLILLPTSYALAPALDLLLLGDRTAVSLGLNVRRQRAGLLALAVGLSSTCVAVGGGIAFVGLLAPHIARRLGRVRHRELLPSAALLGAVLVLVADAAARTLFLPSLMPTGIVVAVLGVPYFLYLLTKN